MNSVSLDGQWSFRWESLEAPPFDVPKCPGWLPAQVPGDVHSDLVAAGLLEEPLKGDNAFHLRPRCPREVILTSAGGSLELRSITLSAVNVPAKETDLQRPLLH